MVIRSTDKVRFRTGMCLAQADRRIRYRGSPPAVCHAGKISHAQSRSLCPPAAAVPYRNDAGLAEQDARKIPTVPTSLEAIADQTSDNRRPEARSAVDFVRDHAHLSTNGALHPDRRGHLLLFQMPERDSPTASMNTVHDCELQRVQPRTVSRLIDPAGDSRRWAVPVADDLGHLMPRDSPATGPRPSRCRCSNGSLTATTRVRSAGGVDRRSPRRHQTRYTPGPQHRFRSSSASQSAATSVAPSVAGQSPTPSSSI